MSDERTENPETTENQQQPAPETEGAASDELAALREQLENQQKRLDQIARAYADVLNERESFQRRVERDRDRQIESARAEVTAVLFDVLDDLRRALLGSESAQDAKGVIEGVRMIADVVRRRVEGMGISPIATVGHYFDPNLHEAVDLVPVEDADQDGKVIEEVRAGWKAGDRVVRPARVRVARRVPAGSGDGAA